MLVKCHFQFPTSFCFHVVEIFQNLKKSDAIVGATGPGNADDDSFHYRDSRFIRQADTSPRYAFGLLPALLFGSVDDVHLLVGTQLNKISDVAGYPDQQIPVFFRFFHRITQQFRRDYIELNMVQT